MTQHEAATLGSFVKAIWDKHMAAEDMKAISRLGAFYIWINRGSMGKWRD